MNLPSAQLPPVVLVDDEPDDLFLLSERLRRANVRNPLVTFVKAADAIAFLKTAFGPAPDAPAPDAPEVRRPKPPCVVITDVKMPGLDGFQLTAWVRAHAEFREVPVIVVSGANDPRDNARAVQLGAAAYFPKFPRAEAIATIIDRASRPRPA